MNGLILAAALMFPAQCEGGACAVRPLRNLIVERRTVVRHVETESTVVARPRVLLHRQPVRRVLRWRAWH